MQTSEAEKIVSDWNKFILLDPKRMVDEILQLSYWQSKFLKLIHEEKVLQSKIQFKIRRRLYELQVTRLEGNLEYNFKNTSEVEIYYNNDELYSQLLCEIDESKSCENLYKEMLTTTRSISMYIKNYIDYKKEFGI